MDLVEVMRTTFAARDFTSDPVSDEQLYRILENARFAPSGGNRQGWRVIVVRDEASRTLLRDCSLPGFQRYLAMRALGETPFTSVTPSQVTEEEVAATPPPTEWVEKVVRAPALLLVAVDLRLVTSFDKDLPRVGVVSGASVYPFVWNILLAARNEGLGGVIVTFMTLEEARVRAHFELPDHFAVAAMLPLGRPVKQLSRLSRKPVEEFTSLERFGGEPFRRPR